MASCKGCLCPCWYCVQNLHFYKLKDKLQGVSLDPPWRGQMLPSMKYCQSTASVSPPFFGLGTPLPQYQDPRKISPKLNFILRSARSTWHQAAPQNLDSEAKQSAISGLGQHPSLFRSPKMWSPQVSRKQFQEPGVLISCPRLLSLTHIL